MQAPCSYERYAGLVRPGDRVRDPERLRGWFDVLDVDWPGRFDVIALTLDVMGQRRTVRLYADDVVTLVRARDRGSTHPVPAV